MPPKILVIGSDEYALPAVRALEREGRVACDRAGTLAEAQDLGFDNYIGVATELELEDATFVDVFLQARLARPGVPVIVTNCEHGDLPSGVSIRERRVSLTQAAFETGGAAAELVANLEATTDLGGIAAQLGIDRAEVGDDVTSICKKMGAPSFGAALARVLLGEV